MRRRQRAPSRPVAVQGERAMQVNLEGKNILITGAASGLGRAMALALLDAGARVAIGHSGMEGCTMIRSS